MGKVTKIVVISLVSIIVSAILVSAFLYLRTENCDDTECFKRNLALCTKAVYTTQAPAVFTYKILGTQDGSCKVNVLFVSSSLIATKILEGKEMTCIVPLNTDVLPEENLEYCSGPLKTEIQKAVITNLHRDITVNLG